MLLTCARSASDAVSTSNAIGHACSLPLTVSTSNADAQVADAAEDDIFTEAEGWHRCGMASHRVMWMRFQQTVYFLPGDDAGAELHQPPVVIEEPDGSTALATSI